jgi:hypothetical protein
VSEAWLWEPTLLLRWRTADPTLPDDAQILRVSGRTVVLEQLWRSRKGEGQDVAVPLVPEIREEWRAVLVVDEP